MQPSGGDRGRRRWSRGTPPSRLHRPSFSANGRGCCICRRDILGEMSRGGGPGRRDESTSRRGEYPASILSCGHPVVNMLVARLGDSPDPEMGAAVSGKGGHSRGRRLPQGAPSRRGGHREVTASPALLRLLRRARSSHRRRAEAGLQALLTKARILLRFTRTQQVHAAWRMDQRHSVLSRSAVGDASSP